MPYISLYRKYRPQRFADVVGQDHVVQTLQNALKAGRIANGYLFCGTRGVAKTTIARVFAKCLNCIGPDGSRTSPTDEPCGECAPCRSISAGQCVDVIEMDAASNRSVSDMAKVRENVQFGPMENRFKTYIVDEAHQLSNDAKDAFLKTLEEPPAGVVFILATTESHAIPVTIASRCQQFDFKRGSLATISSQIRKVLGFESVTMSPDAVTLVARAAEGSYRDALSILEQVIAYKRADVTASDVIEILGSVDASVTGRVVDLIAARDAAGAFALAEEIFIGGKDIRQFLKTLAAHTRDMMFTLVGAKAGGDDPEGGEMAAALAAQASRFTPPQLLRMLEILSEAERESKTANQQRLLLEMTLLRLMMPSASAAQAAEPAYAAPIAAPTAQPSRPAAAPPPAAPRPAERPEPRHEAPAVSAERYRPADADIPAPAEPASLAPRNGAAGGAEPAPASYAEGHQDATAQPVAAPPVPDDAAAPAVTAGEIDDLLAYLNGHWREVVHNFQTASPANVKVIEDARPVALEGTTFTLGFTNKAYVDLFESAKRRLFVEGIIDKVLRADKGTYRVKTVLAKAAPMPAAPIAPPEPAAEEQNSTELLDEVISIFGGKIIEEE